MDSFLIKDVEELGEYLNSIKPQLDQESIEKEIESFKRCKKIKIPYLFGLNDLSKLSNISKKQLIFNIYHKNRVYKSFEIPKKNGDFRTIDAPIYKLKLLQRWILDNILIKINPGDHAHGFIKNRSIVTNSQIHINQDLVLGIDLKNFFPSIKMYRVKGLFSDLGYNEKMAKILSELCTYHFSLPQGAPTSPMIANLIAWNLDQRLAKFCDKHYMKYSRYADDITISGNKDIPRYKTLIFRIICDEGFTINFDKVRLQDRGSCQKVTGLTVNDKVSLGKSKKKNFLATIHNIIKNGPISENRMKDPFFKEIIFGCVSFFYMVEPLFGLKCYSELQKANWEEYDTLYNHKGLPNLELRSIKEGKSFLIKFRELDLFKAVEIPPDLWSQEFCDWLDNLREKCSQQSSKMCANCIHFPSPAYKKCIKHILSHYTKDTGGPHQGHEVCDLLVDTKYLEEYVSVAFIAKSGKMNRPEKDTLIRQCLECSDINEINIQVVTTNGIIDTKLKLDLIRWLKKQNPDQKLCIIMREEMATLLYTFDKTSIQELIPKV